MKFYGVKSIAPSPTLKMRKSHKKLAHVTRRVTVYKYAHTYTQIREGEGGGGPPEIYGGVPLIGGPLKNYFLHLDFFCAQKKRVNLAMKKFKWGRVRK